jgi:hypothetical protein
MIDCRKSTDIGNCLTAQAVPLQIVDHRVDMMSATWKRTLVQSLVGQVQESDSQRPSRSMSKVI